MRGYLYSKKGQLKDNFWEVDGVKYYVMNVEAGLRQYVYYGNPNEVEVCYIDFDIYPNDTDENAEQITDKAVIDNVYRQLEDELLCIYDDCFDGDEEKIY